MSPELRYKCIILCSIAIRIRSKHFLLYELKKKGLILILTSTVQPIPKPLGRMSKTRRVKEKRAQTVGPEVVMSTPPPLPPLLQPPPQLPTPTPAQIIHNRQMNQLRSQYAQYQLFLRQSQILHFPTLPFHFPRPLMPNIFIQKKTP